jgi:Asp/Glu/hydantoin racemase
MKTFVINTATKSEENFVETLLQKLGVSVKTMNTEEAEDFGMLQLMKDVDRNKKVSKETIMNKLKRNYAN